MIKTIFRFLLALLAILVVSQAWGLVASPDDDIYRYDQAYIATTAQNHIYDTAPNLISTSKQQSPDSLSEYSGSRLTPAFIGGFFVAKGGGQTFERVVSNAELKATQQSGLLRGGRESENFFTNNVSLNAKRAQQRLGLGGPLRDARIRFRIKNNVEVTGPRPAAAGRTGTAGGGREFSTSGRIEILRVDRLRK